MRTRTLLFLVQLAYGLAFVQHTSLVVDGTRHYLLFDDAMISMQYARSFAAGQGLVWFPGAARVQGITNPLWTFAMVPPHWLGLPVHLASLPIQLLGALIAAATGLAAGRLHATLRPGTRRAWLSQALTGFSLPLVVWAVLGVEAALLALLVVAALDRLLRDLAAGRLSAAGPVLLAAGVAVRLDFGVLAAALAPAVLWAGRRAGAPVRGLALAALPLACAAGAAALQDLYYGDPLPNTAALKLGVPLVTRAARGAAVSRDAFVALGGPFLALALGVLLASRRTPAPARALVPGLLLAAFAYNVYAGGDAWEWAVAVNRFLLPVAPLALVTLAVALDAGLERLAPGRLAAAAACGAALLATGVGFSLDPARAGTRLAQALLIAPAPMREEHDRGMLRAGVFLREATTRPLAVAVTSAGIAPYVLGRGSFVDVLGKSDRRIAALPPRAGPYLPGHVKWDLRWSIGTLRPDVAIGNWANLGRAFDDPVTRIPGPPDLFVRTARLDDAFVGVPALVALYRRLDYGPEPPLLRDLLGFEGLRAGGDGTRWRLAGRGSLRVPPGTELSFVARAVEPVRLAIGPVGAPERTLLRAGETRRFRFAGGDGLGLELTTRAPQPGGPPPPVVLEDLRLGEPTGR